MDYKLFDDYITLQALLKEVGVIQTGGAAKVFLSQQQVLFNGELENRRGKKIRVGDTVTIPAKNIDLHIVAPSHAELKVHQEEEEEKKRVATLVKEMNKGLKKTKPKSKQREKKKAKNVPVRFPGTK